jgi:hypothetical protein
MAIAMDREVAWQLQLQLVIDVDVGEVAGSVSASVSISKTPTPTIGIWTLTGKLATRFDNRAWSFVFWPVLV